jgi:MFS family permease
LEAVPLHIQDTFSQAEAAVIGEIAMSAPGTFVTAAPRVTRALSYSLLSIISLVLLCLSYSINAADRQIFPTLLPAIREYFGYDLKTAGLLSTIFTLGLAVAGFPAGYLADRFSRKAIILVAMVIYSMFTLATIYAYGFWDMVFYRAMTGVGEGMQMAALFAAIGNFFHRKRSFFIGWLIVAYGVGAFLGPRAGAMLSQSADGWQVPFVWFTFTGLAVAAIVLVFVPKSFTEHAGPQTTAALDEAAIAHVPETLGSRNVILGVVGCVILGYSLYGFIGLYTTYLKDALHFPPSDAAAAFSFFGLGGFVSFIGGWLGDRFQQRWVTAVAFRLARARRLRHVQSCGLAAVAVIPELHDRGARQRLRVRKPAFAHATQRAAAHGGPRLGHLPDLPVRSRLHGRLPDGCPGGRTGLERRRAGRADAVPDRRDHRHGPGRPEAADFRGQDGVRRA